MTRLRAMRFGGQGADETSALASVRRRFSEHGARIAALDWPRIGADLDAQPAWNKK